MTHSVIDQVKQAAHQEMSKLGKEVTRERDELRLQLNLLSVEAKQEWEEIEGSFKQLSGHALNIGHRLGKLGQSGVETMSKLGKSLKAFMTKSA